MACRSWSAPAIIWTKVRKAGERSDSSAASGSVNWLSPQPRGVPVLSEAHGRISHAA